MYRPRHFDTDDTSALHQLMRDEGFALLVTAPGGVPQASHLPFILDTETGGPARLLGHMAKANSQWREFDGKTEAMVMFWGPHAYVSPTWYVSEKMVPTWNYVTVHAYGKPRVLSSPDDTTDVLARLLDVYESEATGPWSMDMLPDEFIEKQLKGIVAFEIPIDRLEGKFKLSQNRSPADREGVIKGLREAGHPRAEAKAIARLMEKNSSGG